MVTLTNLLSKIFGAKRAIWNDPAEKLPKCGRPLVFCKIGERAAYVGGTFNGKYFCFGDFRFHPDTISQWGYKSTLKKAGFKV